MVGVSEQAYFLVPKRILDCLRDVFLFLVIIYVQAGVEILKTRDFKWLVFLLFVTTGMQGAARRDSEI